MLGEKDRIIPVQQCSLFIPGHLGYGVFHFRRGNYCSRIGRLQWVRFNCGQVVLVLVVVRSHWFIVKIHMFNLGTGCTDCIMEWLYFYVAVYCTIMCSV